MKCEHCEKDKVEILGELVCLNRHCPVNPHRLDDHDRKNKQ